MVKKVYIETLGCPKNTVDSENMAFLLDEAGYAVSESAEDCDIYIINTCAFIDAAKEESVSAIMQAVSLKNENPQMTIVVSGCFAQRYAAEIRAEIPEVDFIVGTGRFAEIAELISAQVREDVSELNAPIAEVGRMLSTPNHYAYLKLAEGCNKSCSYCIIPKLRGRQRSRRMEDILAEATELCEGGVKELILIAQDTGEYGTDLYGSRMLPELMRRLSAIEPLRWIRLLYVYPETISDELIDVMAGNPKILHYIDIPFQHVNNRILKLMRRAATKEKIIASIEKLRAAMPDIAIRSTFITGFPSETEAEVAELSEFLEKYHLERVGVFPYSREEGTPAAEMEGQLDEAEKTRRFELLMSVQERVSDKTLSCQLDRTLSVLIEDIDSDGNPPVYVGRSYLDAPDIDGIVYVYTDKMLEIGEFYDVEIFDSMEYDLIGRVK